METIERKNYQLVEVINLHFKEAGKSQRMRVRAINTNEEVGVLISFTTKEEDIASAIKYNYRTEKESFVELVDRINLELGDVLLAIYKDVKEIKKVKTVDAEINELNDLLEGIAKEILEELTDCGCDECTAYAKLINGIILN